MLDLLFRQRVSKLWLHCSSPATPESDISRLATAAQHAAEGKARLVEDLVRGRAGLHQTEACDGTLALMWKREEILNVVHFLYQSYKVTPDCLD